MDAVTGFDPFDQMIAAGVVGGVDQIQTGLINGNGIQACKDADIFHTGVLCNGAAVAVYGHVLHYVDIGGLAVEIVHHGAGGIGHGFQKAVVVCGPDLGGVAGAVDIGLAIAGGHTDRQLLQGAAIAAHGVAFEVR